MNLSDIPGIKTPVIQAPMAGVQDWELAVAVSEAGGLGSIPCGMLSHEQIVSEIESFRSHSNRPYNLNFFTHDMPETDVAALKRWETLLRPYFESWSVIPPEQVSGLRLPFDRSIADLIEPYKPPVISFHFGLPEPGLVSRIKSWGTVIMSSATTVAEGLWLESHGADIVIAQGNEAGGHRAMFLTDDINTQLPTRELVTALTGQLPVPVIAAGGLAGKQDIYDVMQLGASGAQLGTAYLLCREAKTTRLHREALKSVDAPTALTNVFSGRPARGITNRLMLEIGPVSEAAPEFPYASVALAPLRKAAEASGLTDFTPLWSGTNRSGCREISAGELTLELWDNG
ncbi:MAG: nitronate monooxygenase [Thiolinea sp.]